MGTDTATKRDFSIYGRNDAGTLVTVRVYEYLDFKTFTYKLCAWHPREIGKESESVHKAYFGCPQEI